MDTDELTRPRWEIALDVVVWAVKNDFPDTDEVPASIALNAAEVVILESLSAREIAQMFALFYLTAAEYFEAGGWDEEAVESIAQVGYYADAASRWLARRSHDRYERGRPDRRHARRARSRKRRAVARQRARAPTSDDDSPSPSDIDARGAV